MKKTIEMNENRYLMAFVTGLIVGGTPLDEDDMIDPMYLLCMLTGVLIRFCAVAWVILLLVEKALS